MTSAGLSSAVELLGYPRTLAQLFLRDGDFVSAALSTTSLSGHEAARSFLGRGVRLYTRYSGIGMAEIACHAYQRALEQEFERSGMTFEWAGFSSAQAWDLKPSARRILLDLDERVQPAHVFGNMLGMFPQKVIDTIDGLNLAAAEHREAFWAHVQDFFGEIEKQPALHRHRHAFCYKHGGRCEFGLGGGSFEGLRLCVAGVTCKDFSTMNATRQGVLGPSGVPLLTFIFDVRRNRYDVLVTECTPLQDLKPFEDFLSHLYTWETFLLGPEDSGSWATRRRRFVVFWLKREHGGKVEPGLPMSGLLPLIRRRRPDAKYNNMFAMAPPSHVALARSQLLRLPRAHDRGNEETWESCLCPTKQARLQIQRQVFLERHGVPNSDLQRLTSIELLRMVRHWQRSDGFETWVDLDHQPNTGWGKQSKPLPTLISHGSIFGLGINRCLIADESMVAQGLDLFGVAARSDAPSPTRPPWGQAWSNLSESCKKDLCGNTINCEVLMSIIGYIIRVAAPVRVDGNELQGRGCSRFASEDLSAASGSRGAKRARSPQ